jgi:YHS domain-containing protein
MIVDPVCGMEFDVKHAAETLAYGDEVYHFCSRTCRDLFLQDPGGWLREVEEEEEEVEYR